MDRSLRASILIVSTTAADDPSTDASFEVLHNVLKDQGDDRWELFETKIVTDDVLAIQRQVMRMADGPEAANLIITTGGTGFAVTDGTPEVCSSLLLLYIPKAPVDNLLQAVAPLLHKHAPGLVHAMLSTSLNVTPCKTP